MIESPNKSVLLKALIDARAVHVLFQPIVDLNDGLVIAYEALCRPAPDMGFKGADEMFETAGHCGQLWELEQLARNCAMEAACNWPRDVRLFLNTSPEVFGDERFAGVIETLAGKAGLSTERIVLEITERAESQFDDRLLKHANLAKELGYSVAVDDAGAGTSGLNRMMQLRPQWVKLDRGLVSGIDKDPFKQNLVRFFIHFARMSGVSVVAEGIEHGEELATLIGLGVRFGQGYYLAKPGDRATTLDPMNCSDIRERWACVEAAVPPEPREMPMIRLTRTVLSVDGTRHQVAELAAMLANHPEHAGIVVTEGRRLMGWADRESVINSSFGTSAVSSIIAVMRPAVCALTPDSTVQDALQLVCTREDHDLSQPLIIATGSEIVGVVPMRDLLRAAATESRPSSGARAAITGLPARVGADQHLEEMIARGKDAALRLSSKYHSDCAFVDIRRFADYNGVFGYEMGDRLIRSLSDELNTHVVRGHSDVFIAHLGDDRFIVTARAGLLEPRLNALIQSFDRLAPTLTDADVIDHISPSTPRANVSGLKMGLRVLLMPSVFDSVDHARDIYRTEQQLRQKSRNQEKLMAAGQSVFITDRRHTGAWADKLSA